MADTIAMTSDVYVEWQQMALEKDVQDDCSLLSFLLKFYKDNKKSPSPPATCPSCQSCLSLYCSRCFLLTPSHLTPSHLTPSHLTPSHLTPSHLTLQCPQEPHQDVGVSEIVRTTDMANTVSETVRTTDMANTAALTTELGHGRIELTSPIHSYGTKFPADAGRYEFNGSGPCEDSTTPYLSKRRQRARGRKTVKCEVKRMAQLSSDSLDICTESTRERHCKSTRRTKGCGTNKINNSIIIDSLAKKLTGSGTTNLKSKVNLAAPLENKHDVYESSVSEKAVKVDTTHADVAFDLKKLSVNSDAFVILGEENKTIDNAYLKTQENGGNMKVDNVCLETPQNRTDRENENNSRVVASTHQQCRENTAVLRCTQCLFVGPTLAKLDYHFRKFHQETRPEFPCPFCGKVLRSTYTLKEHIRCHTGDRPYKCDVENCGATFTLSSTYKAHMRQHKGDHPYLCPHCGKSFVRSSNLSVHIRVCTGIKPYKCVACGKAFADAGYFRTHVNNHLGIRRYKCEYCGKEFSQSTNLRLHIRTHTMEKPHACPQCPLTFATPLSLKEHWRTHSGQKPFTCDVCGKAFSRSCNRLAHRRAHHAP